MESNLVEYVCPECGAIVHFFPGFEMTCKSKRNTASHAFTPPKKNTSSTPLSVIQ